MAIRDGADKMSQRIATPLLDVRSSAMMGTTALLLSWSTLKTAKPAWIMARDRVPRPAKSSTNRGLFEFCAEETPNSVVQSAWLQR